MSRRSILTMTLVAVLFLMPLVAGCGGGSTEEKAAPAESAATETAAETTEAAAETVATHDCDGGCGMTGVAEAKLTEVEGKWYCAGCAKKAQEAHGDDDG